MAKDVLLKHARLYIGIYDMSGIARGIGSLINEFERVDQTAWDNGVMRAMGNRRTVAMEDVALLLDSATGKSIDASEADQSVNVSFLIGSGGAPAFGDLAFCIPAVQANELFTIDGGAVGINGIRFEPEPTQSNINYLYPIGLTMEIATERTATQTSASIDNGASTANGYSAFLHVLSTGADFAIEIQHSINDADWSTLKAFTADGSALASEHVGATGTVNRYVRYLATRTSGNLTAVCVLIRNPYVQP